LNPGVWWGPILKNLRKKRKRDEGGRERKEGRKEAVWEPGSITWEKNGIDALPHPTLHPCFQGTSRLAE
jgi:hypothetical protein